MITILKEALEKRVPELEQAECDLVRTEEALRESAERALQESEEIYRRVFESSLDGLVIFDSKGFVREVNPAACTMHGYTPEELIGSPGKELVAPESHSLFDDFVQAVSSNQPFATKAVNLRKDGSRMKIEVRGTPISLKGQPHLLGIVRDITEQKLAEEAVKASERNYREIFNGVNEMIFVHDAKTGAFKDINQAALDVFGYTKEEMMKLTVEDLSLGAPPFTRKEAGRWIKKAFDEGSQRFEWRARKKNGDLFWSENNLKRVFVGGEDCILCIARDITKQKQAEEALRFMNTILLTQQETSLDGILVVDDEGKMITFNKRFVELWNIPSDVLESWSDQLALKSVLGKLADPKEFLDQVNRLYKNRIKKSHEEIVLVDGRTFERYSTPMTGPEGRHYGRVWYFRDITERKRREAKLKESEQRYRAVVEDMPALVCRFRSDGVLTFVNNAYCHYFGKKKEDLIGKDFFHFIPKDDREKVRHHINSLNDETPMTTYEHQVIAPDGVIRWQEWTDRALFDEKGRLMEYQSVGRDITEAKIAREEKAKIEKQLQQARKMESVGRLAGGIAHDFNNMLTPIIVHTEMALDDIPNESPLRFGLEQVLKAGERARDLTRQILAFSRQSEGQQVLLKIEPIVKEVLKLLRASLPATIEIRTRLECEPGSVFADLTQIHQLLMNLCVNAAQAMLQKGGVLEISTMNQTLDAAVASRVPGLKPGAHLRLSVADTGQGMGPKVIEHVFDPYFTTKEKGEGTGLGLSVVHGIVGSLGGAVTVESEPGIGSTFHVYLPVIERKATSEEIQDAVPLPRGTEQVLLVDDEQSIVEAVKSVLEHFGYRVTARTSSVEALEVFRSDSERFDLVITDQTMPNLTGVELATEIMKINPGIPVILCTGFSELIDEEKARAMGIRSYVMKPIVTRQIMGTIRRLLDDR